MSHDPNCLFCKFVRGEADAHRSGAKFHPIHETAHSLVFLSIDPPTATNEHLLVIPKKHYASMEDIPQAEAHDLMDLLQLSMRVLRTEYQAANVLQNNGREAGQYVFHVHYHLIPRFPEDGLQIEVWNHRAVEPALIEASTKMLTRKFQAFLEQHPLT